LYGFAHLDRREVDGAEIMNITRILCPTDFSEASAHAIDLAITIARWYKARVAAVHVIDAGAGLEFGASPDGPLDEAELKTLRAATAEGFSAAASVGVPVDVDVEVGSAANRILDRCAALPADLIVMGTHGKSGFQHLVLGSVTERVLRRAVCPVLSVPPRAHSTSRVPFQRLLCAVDFSESSMAALQFAVSLAQESDARLTMLHVLEWPWHEPPSPKPEDLPAEQGAALVEYRRYREKMALMRLESLANATSLSQSPATRVSHGKPYVQILDTARDEGSDLIVIGVHGRNPFDMMMFGSTANQIVRQASCPVLTLRK
jgi:nucleotide-binding universal stress UspA family protein